MFEHFPGGVVIVGPEQVVEYANSQAHTFAGLPSLAGLPMAAALPFDDNQGHMWSDVVQPYGGLMIRKRIAEQSWWSSSGEEFLITASMVRDRPSGPVRTVVVSLRSAKVRNMRDRERSDLVATAAHELKSPLTGIKGFTATLLSKWDKFSEDQRLLLLRTVDADADRLSRLVIDLLDATRIDAGRMELRREPVRVDDVIGRALASISASPESTLGESVRVHGELPTVWADADRLTQVTINLAENAIRHGRGLRAVEINAEGEGVRIRFVDSGPGIPPDARSRVFSRFWRSGPAAGSGLGLFIVHGIVEAHDGTVAIDDAPGGGADINFWLPVAEPAVLRDH